MPINTLEIALNRVEGDLEVRVQVEDSVVTEAFCSGTMYRGIEGLLRNRGALDGLVITPRVCGICTTGHLSAAVRALDMISSVVVPPDALRVRNLTLMAEHLQSDIRHSLMMFAADFVNPAHAWCDLFPEAERRYSPLKGESVVEVIRQSKRVLEIVAIFGGQWPHSSFMVPGGVTSVPSMADLLQCKLLLKDFRCWYEKRVLGCTIERWHAVRSADDLDEWLEEQESQRTSELGFFVRYARAIGLDRIGRGHGSFISFGSLELPEGTKLKVRAGARSLIAPGFARGLSVQPFDPRAIREDTTCSWYLDGASPQLHPSEGITQPYATGKEGIKYSWAKAPRYEGVPAETGALAEVIVGEHPLFRELISDKGPSAFVRQLARLVRPTEILPAMEVWLEEIHAGGGLYNPPSEIVEGVGIGLIHASRGALGHWVRIEDGRIQSYQIITPTTWNASPRDKDGVRGPIEQALVGTPVKDPENPIEVGHVVRSFDPCLVCTVHAVRPKGRGFSIVASVRNPS